MEEVGSYRDNEMPRRPFWFWNDVHDDVTSPREQNLRLPALTPTSGWKSHSGYAIAIADTAISGLQAIQLLFRRGRFARFSMLVSDILEETFCAFD